MSKDVALHKTSINILIGEARTRLKQLPDNSVHCCVTSPPYWGLRAYGNDEGMLGLESTPDEYIGNLVEVFSEVKRVLRNDGTLWLNLGDTYAANRTYQVPQTKYVDVNNSTGMKVPKGYKAKDLLQIPARTAMALQADGWWLRSEIIWHKPNGMPRNIKDRPVDNHEKVFLLAKSRKYFYDWFGVRTENAHLRSVWPINTKGFKGAHFATFPPALVEPCMQAGASSGGVCGQCGVPYVRHVVREHQGVNPVAGRQQLIVAGGSQTGGDGTKSTLGGKTAKFRSEGWEANCACSPCKFPATVLDPFAGSGTVGMVAAQQGKDSILIEINDEYADLSRKRLEELSDSSVTVYGKDSHYG